MASSLLRLTKTVSSFLPPVTMSLSANRLPRQHSVNKTRSFSSPPDKHVPNITFNLPFLMQQMQIMPEAPSMLITVVNGQQLTINIPGMSKTETDNRTCFSIYMPGLRMPKGECQSVTYEKLIVDNNMLIYLNTHTTKHIILAGIKLPHNLDLSGKCDISICKGVFKLTFPVIKTSGYVMPDLVEATAKMPRPTSYCETFDRCVIGKDLCEVIAHPKVKSKSFTGYKKDTGESIYIKGDMPGVEKIVVTKEGLCVTLNMPGLEIEDVEVGFEYDTLIIEGKREGEHYIAGVRVPEGFRKEHDMMKREMQDGVYKVTLPHDEGDEKKTNRRVFSVYR